MAGMDGSERESGTKQLQESSPDYIAGQDAEEPPDPPASIGAWRIRQTRFDIIWLRAAPRGRPRRPRHRRPGQSCDSTRAPLVFSLLLKTACFAIWLVACDGGSSQGATSTPLPPVSTATIPDVSVFLAQTVCLDRSGKAVGLAVPGATCTAKRPQRASDPMFERRHDWPAPTGFQIEDSVASDDDREFVTTWSYPPFGPFVAANGDGGEVFVSDGTTVRIAVTQDGGKPGLQYFVGRSCGGTGWIVFRNDVPTGKWADLVAALGDSPDPGACKEGSRSYTRYRREHVRIPFIINGVRQAAIIPTIISEHYTGRSLATATALERFFLGQGWGQLIWEAWRPGAPAIDLSARCPGTAWSVPPVAGWQLHDCRYATNITPAVGSFSVIDFGWPPSGTPVP